MEHCRKKEDLLAHLTKPEDVGYVRLKLWIMAADVREPRYVYSLWSSKFKMRASKHQNLITVFEFRILKLQANSKNHVDAYWS